MAGTGKKKGNRLSATRTLPRERRLQSAKEWLQAYKGKHLVRAYAKRFHVDLLCAITELRLLGIAITEEYETAVKRSVADRIALKKQKKSESVTPLQWGVDQDEHFAFIAGYTPGGAAYGIRWEDLSEEERQQYSIR